MGVSAETTGASRPWPSLGVELEMPTAHARTGATHPVGPFFRNLAEILKTRGLDSRLLRAGERDCGLSSPRGLHSLDNGFNNLESSLGVLPGEKNSLNALAGLVHEEIRDVGAALAREDAVILNFSEHPAVRVDPAFYYAVRAPKSLYDYQINHRGWNHMAGFDAKAHNSPNTGLDFERAIPFVNCLLGLAPAFIALYANSPFEAGQLTANKENRLTLWFRQMGCSRMAGDRKLSSMPQRPFRHLAGYLRWMFGPGTRMWFAGHEGSGKNPGNLYLVPGDPPLLDFLRGGPRRAVPMDPGKRPHTIVPSIHHLEYHQFTQYTDCRLRYALSADTFDLETFFQVLDERPADLEELFQAHTRHCYIEGRAAGANFLDQELADMAGDDVAASVTVSPSALQTGLLLNLERTRRLVSGYAWTDLVLLREQAMRHALDGECGNLTVRGLCAAVLEIAGQGLATDDAWMLAYPAWVLKTGLTGADRAVKRFERLPGPPEKRIAALIRERRVVQATGSAPERCFRRFRPPRSGCRKADQSR